MEPIWNVWSVLPMDMNMSNTWKRFRLSTLIKARSIVADSAHDIQDSNFTVSLFQELFFLPKSGIVLVQIGSFQGVQTG